MYLSQYGDRFIRLEGKRKSFFSLVQWDVKFAIPLDICCLKKREAANPRDSHSISQDYKVHKSFLSSFTITIV